MQKKQNLKKNERKEILNKYYQTDIGMINKKRYLRLLIYGILCLAYGIFLITEQIIKQDSIWYYILGIIVLICGLIFLMGRHKLIIKNINDFARKNKKK